MGLDEVKVVSLTYGFKGHFNPEFDDLSDMEKYQIKEKEFLKASKIVGAECGGICGFTDEPYIYNDIHIIAMVTLIRSYQPDIVITHHPNEYAHWDHAKCGEMMCRALKASVKLKGKKYYVPMVYFFGVAFRPESARMGIVPQPPDLLVNIEGLAIEKKVKAMCCFKSQGHDDEEKMWKRMDSFDSEMGRADGFRYSEGFIFNQPLKRNQLLFNEDKGFY